MSALWGVIIGGLLTIGGQLAAEAWKAHVAKSERAERRAAVKREHQRQAATQVTYDALAYRRALVENERSATSTPAIEDQLTSTRAAYEAALYRVESNDCRARFLAWENAAIAWSQGEGLAVAETTAWRTAMEAAGGAVRSAL